MAEYPVDTGRKIDGHGAFHGSYGKSAGMARHRTRHRGNQVGRNYRSRNRGNLRERPHSSSNALDYLGSSQSGPGQSLNSRPVLSLRKKRAAPQRPKHVGIPQRDQPMIKRRNVWCGVWKEATDHFAKIARGRRQSWQVASIQILFPRRATAQGLSRCAKRARCSIMRLGGMRP
jgi:hypothetical protein